MSLHVVINNGLNHNGIKPDDWEISWYIAPNFAMKQVAYSIFVYENKECTNIVFETGRLEGVSPSYHYNGKELKYNHRYILQVKVWCDTGDVLQSELITIVTCTDAWKAFWISCGDSSAMTSCFSNFKKFFSIDKPISSAVAYTSFHTFGKLWINQQIVTGPVTPAPSHITKSKYYLSYDVTDFLRNGDNTFDAQIYHINGNSQSFVKGFPGFILQVFLYYEDGTADCLVSNTDWYALSSTAYKNDTPFQVSRELSTVQEYDYNHESADWLSTNYSVRSWEKASLSQIDEQSWNMVPQYVPEGIIHEIISPTPLAVQQPSVQVFDAGKIVSGWVKICVKTQEAQTISIRYAEALDEDGRVLHKVANQFTEFYYDTFITKGGEECCYEADFVYKAFRYVEITGCPFVIDAKDIQVISVGTNIDFKGSFQCSNSLLNGIFKACIQTQHNNVVNMMTDCPHREQSQYIEDSNLQLETLLYNFNAFPLALKMLDDFAQAQFEDGTFPFVFPATFPKDILKIPEWDLYYIEVLYKTYRYFGNSAILEQHYDTCRRIVAHSIRKIRKNGLVHCGDGWHIDDWPYPKNQESGMEYRTGENVLVYNNLVTISRIAYLLGRCEEGCQYAEQAEKLRLAIVKNLYNPIIKRFYDGSDTVHISQAINVSAFYYGLVPKQDYQVFLNWLATSPDECSVVMRQKLMCILFENGYEERAYELLTSDEYPSWGYMIRLGFGTMWEGFDDKESHTHAWNAYPARLMQEYLCGIVLKDIFKGTVLIKPYVPEELTFARAEVITPHGIVSVSWEKVEDVVQLIISVPSTVCLCVESPKGYTLLKKSDDGCQYIFK